jgi:outer membrane protein OmpA-like peptidoglycan-associated protein
MPVADRTQQVVTPAPVAELVAAWHARSADRFVAVLAPDARVAVPPLHLELSGRDDVWVGVAHVFAAFGALRYTMRHRYLTPETVTDEVLLEGLQTQEFLGAPPPGHPGSVAARVMMRHDGLVVTELTVWPDVAALRELSDGVARRIDLRTAGPAAPVVAALRATIPAPAARLSVGEGREVPSAATTSEVGSSLAPGAPPAPGSGLGAGHGGSRGSGHEKGRRKPEMPKAPLPRRARRLRAVLAGVAMLVVAAALVTYVVVGVNRSRDVRAAAAGRAKPGATPTTAPGHARGAGGSAPASRSSSSSAPEPTPSATPSFDPRTSSYTIPNTVLFALNSATLLPDARNALDQVVEGVVHEKRYGRIIVTGYTDSSGGLALNLSLSDRRAKAVAVYLNDKLDDHFELAYVGLGPENPRAPNDSPEHMALNRRVEIKVPTRRSGGACPRAVAAVRRRSDRSVVGRPAAERPPPARGPRAAPGPPPGCAAASGTPRRSPRGTRR